MLPAIRSKRDLSSSTLGTLSASNPMPAPVMGGPVRAFVATVCTAEVSHANADFWSIVHGLKAAPMFDVYAEPDCADAFRLSHEIQAAGALNWLSHLQGHDSDRRGPWARYDGMSIDGKRDWLRRRRYLLASLLRAVTAYKAARAATPVLNSRMVAAIANAPKGFYQ